MELKQLEYFAATIEEGSINRAATALYTTQPHVSRTIRQLEKELGTKLIQRSATGITITETGSQLYVHAKSMLKNKQIIQHIASCSSAKQLKIASYHSNMLSKRLSEYYIYKKEDNLHIEFFSGTTHQVIHYVSSGISNMGFVFFSQKQKLSFQHELNEERLDFHKINGYELCIYVGPHHPFYRVRDEISLEELRELKFVQSQKDYSSLLLDADESTLDSFSLLSTHHVIHTNSEHVILNMLLHTDLCTLDLYFFTKDFDASLFHVIRIRDYSVPLTLGYVTRKGYVPAEYEEDFLNFVLAMYNGS